VCAKCTCGTLLQVASADLERACAGAHKTIADVAAVAVPPHGNREACLAAKAGRAFPES
jgi:hypothetical protein